MADTLDDLKRNLKRIANNISEKMNEQQGYLKEAEAIQVVYDRLLRDKNTIKGYRKNINAFLGKSYDGFKGDNFKNKYKPSVQDLRDSYDEVISGIDLNLDTLNNKILEYKNKAANCWGPLGYLQSSYNSLKTQIQNWTN